MNSMRMNDFRIQFNLIRKVRNQVGSYGRRGWNDRILVEVRNGKAIKLRVRGQNIENNDRVVLRRINTQSGLRLVNLEQRVNHYDSEANTKNQLY